MCKRFLTFCFLQEHMARNSRLTFCCGMAKSRDGLIFVDAPWLRYFAKQNLWTEILQGEVCKCKSLYISLLTASYGTVCSKKAQKRAQKGTFCMASCRQFTRFQPSKPSSKMPFAIAKGHKQGYERAQTPPSKAVFGKTKDHKGVCRKLFRTGQPAFSR